jgi:hypothetical protein
MEKNQIERKGPGRPKNNKKLTNINENDEERKRPPGRPRITPIPDPIPIRGIVNEPIDKKNIIEMKYSQLQNLKKISAYFKSLNAEKVQMVFTEEGLEFYTENYLETNTVNVTLYGHKMNSYYCGRRVEITASRSNLELIFGKLDKKYESILFTIEDSNRITNLYISLNSVYKIPEHFKVELLLNDDSVNNTQLFENIDNPTIEMKLTGGFFKKVIQDVKGGFKKEIKISKCGTDNNVYIESISENKQVTVEYPIPNDLILVSNVQENEIFSVSLHINSIKPTSTNTLAEYVYLRLWVDRPAYIYATTKSGDVRFNVKIAIIDCRIIE